MFTVSSVPKSPGLAEKGILMCAGSCFPWKNNFCQEEIILVAEIEGGIERGAAVCRGNDPRIPDRLGLGGTSKLKSFHGQGPFHKPGHPKDL